MVKENPCTKCCSHNMDIVCECNELVAYNHYHQGRVDAIDEVRNLITQKLQTECHFKYCDDSDDCCEVNALMWLDEQLKEKHNEQS